MKGQPLASPHAGVAPPTERTPLPLAWSGGSTRAIAGITGTGAWYRLGADLVDVRGVDVPAGTGPPRDESCLPPDTPCGRSRACRVPHPAGPLTRRARHAAPTCRWSRRRASATPPSSGARRASGEDRPQGPALSSPPADLANAASGLRARQHPGDLCCADEVGAPCPLGTGVLSHPSGSRGLLQTLAVPPGHQAVGPGARRLGGVALTPATVTAHPEASPQGKK